jgi:hypothetical protein
LFSIIFYNSHPLRLGIVKYFILVYLISKSRPF